MKAIELMQKLGELVAEHGDLDMVMVIKKHPYDDYDYLRDVSLRVIEVSNQQDINLIAVSSRK